MANILGSLFVELKANTAGFIEGMTGAGRSAREAGKEIESSFSKLGSIASSALAPLGPIGVQIGQTLSQVGTWARSAAESMTGMGGAVEVVGAGAGILGGGLAAVASGAIALAVHSAESTARMFEQAQAAGVSVEALSGLSYVARQAGVSQETMTTALERMSKTALATATGTKGAVAAYGELGIQLKNTDGTMRSADNIFEQIAARFAAMPDGILKTALAMQIFGRGGAALIPVLDQGGAAIDTMIKRAQALGIVIDSETGEAAHHFEQSLNDLKAAGEGFSLQIEKALLPALQTLLNQIQVAPGQFGAVITSVSELTKNFLNLTEGIIAAGRYASAFWDLTAGAGPFSAARRKAFSDQVSQITADLKAGNAFAIPAQTPEQSLLAGNDEFAQRQTKNRVAAAITGSIDDDKKQKKFGDERDSELLLSYNKQLDETIKRNALAASGDPWVQTDASLSKLTLDMSTYNAKFKEAQEIHERYLPAFEKYRQEQEALNNLVANYGLTQEDANKALLEYGVSIGAISGQATKQLDKMGESWKSFGDHVASDLGKLATSGKEFSKVLADMVKQLGEMALKAALVGGGGGGGGSKSGFGGILGSVFGGFRAGGGSVDPGGMYMVGESGPELFSPQSPGTVVPNGGFGGHSVTYNVDARGAAPGVGPEVVSALKQAEDRAVFRSINALRQLNVRTAGGVFGS